MQGRREQALTQARRNADDLAKWIEGRIGPVRVTAVLVAWTGLGIVGDGWKNRAGGRTVLVQGPALARWLKDWLREQNDELLPRDLERLKCELERQTKQTRAVETANGRVHVPTLGAMFERWAVQPTLGVALFVVIARLVAVSHNGVTEVLTTAGAFVGALVAAIVECAQRL